MLYHLKCISLDDWGNFFSTGVYVSNNQHTISIYFTNIYWDCKNFFWIFFWFDSSLNIRTAYAKDSFILLMSFFCHFQYAISHLNKLEDNIWERWTKKRSQEKLISMWWIILSVSVLYGYICFKPLHTIMSKHSFIKTGK